jgi:hypothetical protein
LEETKTELEKYKNLYENSRKESYYQEKLQKILGGTHKKVKLGVTDISTSTTIYEIKNWKNHKESLGQLLSYNYLNNKELCVCFFGNRPKEYEAIRKLYDKYNIKILEIIDIESGVKLEVLSESNEIRDILRNTYCIGNRDDYVKMKDIIRIYRNNNILIKRENIIENVQKYFEGCVFSKKVRFPNEFFIKSVFRYLKTKDQ